MKINQELINEYVDLATTMRFFEENEAYADEVEYYESQLDQQIFDRLHKLQMKIVKTHPFFKKRNPRTVWSMGSLELVLPFAEGKVRLEYEGGWGADGTSKVVTNPTGLDMYVLAEQLILMSGDRHHVFIEDMEFMGEYKGVKRYVLGTGS